MTRRATVNGRFVQFFRKADKPNAREQGVWKKFYRSVKDALQAKILWETKARIQ